MHQDGTQLPNVWTYPNKIVGEQYNSGTGSNVAYQDISYTTADGRRYYTQFNGAVANQAGTGIYKYTSRPTNTSVLFCIKFETGVHVPKYKYLINTEKLQILVGEGRCQLCMHNYEYDNSVKLPIEAKYLPHVTDVRNIAYLDGKVGYCFITTDGHFNCKIYENNTIVPYPSGSVYADLIWSYGEIEV